MSDQDGAAVVSPEAEIPPTAESEPPMELPESTPINLNNTINQDMADLDTLLGYKSDYPIGKQDSIRAMSSFDMQNFQASKSLGESATMMAQWHQGQTASGVVEPPPPWKIYESMMKKHTVQLQEMQEAAHEALQRKAQEMSAAQEQLFIKERNHRIEVGELKQEMAASQLALTQATDAVIAAHTLAEEVAAEHTATVTEMATTLAETVTDYDLRLIDAATVVEEQQQKIETLHDANEMLMSRVMELRAHALRDWKRTVQGRFFFSWRFEGSKKKFERMSMWDKRSDKLRFAVAHTIWRMKIMDTDSKNRAVQNFKTRFLAACHSHTSKERALVRVGQSISRILQQNKRKAVHGMRLKLSLHKTKNLALRLLTNAMGEILVHRKQVFVRAMRTEWQAAQKKAIAMKNICYFLAGLVCGAKQLAVIAFKDNYATCMLEESRKSHLNAMKRTEQAMKASGIKLISQLLTRLLMAQSQVALGAMRKAFSYHVVLERASRALSRLLEKMGLWAKRETFVQCKRHYNEWKARHGLVLRGLQFLSNVLYRLLRAEETVMMRHCVEQWGHLMNLCKRRKAREEAAMRGVFRKILQGEGRGALDAWEKNKTENLDKTNTMLLLLCYSPKACALGKEPHATDCTLRHVVLRLIGAFKENSREFKLDRFSKGLELLQKIQKRIQTREMSNAYFWINSNRLEQSAQDAAMQFAKEKENLKSSFMQNMSKQDNELEAFQNPMAIRCCVAPAC